MWQQIISICREKQLSFAPDVIHIDFEQAMHNAIMCIFSDCRIDCCRFHLAQNWWRKIQSVGLSNEYKDKTCEIAKWLSQFFGLPFLPPDEIEECFNEEIMPNAPSDEKCTEFLDYLVNNYICSDLRYPSPFGQLRLLKTARGQIMVRSHSILTTMNNFIRIIRTCLYSST